jgi:hypothetical protein
MVAIYTIVMDDNCSTFDFLLSPDIFQEKMSELMFGLEFARAYLNVHYATD